MSDIGYIKRCAKQQLNEWLYDPYYERERTVNGAAQFTLARAKNQIAWHLGFADWGGLAKTSDMRLRFSKLFLKHYWVGKDGICSACSDTYDLHRKYITENYAYVQELADYLNGHVRKIKSVNLRYTGGDIYKTIKASLDNDIGFLGVDKITYGCFIMAAMLAGFKYCRNRRTGQIYFNMSAQNLKALRQTNELYAEVYGALPGFVS